MWIKNDGSLISDDAPYVDADGTRYPGNFPKEQIAELSPVVMTEAPEVPATKRAEYEIVDGVQVWRIVDLTAEELAAVRAVAREGITRQIDTLERDSMLNRGSREMQLFQLEERAAQYAQSAGVPVADVLRANVYYCKLFALNAQIEQLRAQLG